VFKATGPITRMATQLQCTSSVAERGMSFGSGVNALVPAGLRIAFPVYEIASHTTQGLRPRRWLPRRRI
jgi:hypothetical protein